MSRKKLIKIALIFCALSCSNLILAQDEQEQNNQQDQPDRYEKFQHSKFGKEIRGRNVFTAAIGTVVPNGDFMNPLWEIYFHAGYKRFLSSHINLNLTYHKFNIAYDELFNNGFMSFDLNVEVYLTPYDLFTPYIYGGVGLNAANHFVSKEFKAQGGIGLEYLVSENLGIKLGADFNQVFSDDHLDGREFGISDDVYWRMALGLNWYFGSRKQSNKIADDVPTVIESNPIVDDY